MHACCITGSVPEVCCFRLGSLTGLAKWLGKRSDEKVGETDLREGCRRGLARGKGRTRKGGGTALFHLATLTWQVRRKGPTQVSQTVVPELAKRIGEKVRGENWGWWRRFAGQLAKMGEQKEGEEGGEGRGKSAISLCCRFTVIHCQATERLRKPHNRMSRQLEIVRSDFSSALPVLLHL